MFLIHIFVISVFMSLLMYSRGEECQNINCECLDDDISLEYHCPLSDWYRKLVIQKIDKRKITWQCIDVDEMDKYLPTLKLSAEEVNIYDCPLLTTEAALKIDFEIVKTMTIRNATITSGFMEVMNMYPESISILRNLLLKSVSFDNDIDFEKFNAPQLNVMIIENTDFRYGRKIFEYQLKLKRLELRSNHITELKEKTFENLFELEFLDLSSNNISQIDSDAFENLFALLHLSLNNNDIGLLEPGVFRDLKRLTTLDLSNNNICLLHKDVLKPLKSLREITLNNNDRLELDDYLFANFSELISIDIQFSNMKTIPENVFSGATNIQLINLEKNLLSHIPISLFDGLSNLVNLNLKNNEIQTLDSRAFKSLSRLASLDLSSNRIEYLKAEMLRPMQNLQRIEFSSNKIYYIAEDTFSNHGNLRQLHLSNNRYKFSLNSKTMQYKNPFVKCNRLEKLDLSYNLIEDIPDDLFDMSSNLRALMLTGNKIKFLDLTKVWKIAYKELMLSLDQNKITKFLFNETSLPEEAEQPEEEEHASYVFLSQNPIHCDCKANAFLRFINNVMQRSAEWGILFLFNHVECASPENLKGLEFNHLSRYISGCN